MRTPRLTAVAALVLLLSGCADFGSPATPETSEAPSPRPSPTLDTSVSPLTGLRQARPPKNPVFLVKIENTHSGQPQYGVNQADFVVEELVEGGVTRLAAFYYSKLPTKLGHVRSSRITDIYLAEPLDATIVASGGAPKTLRKIVKSELPYYSYDKRSPGWSSDPSKSPPYHVLWNLQTLNANVKPAVPPKSYFEWGKGTAGRYAKKRTAHASVTFSPASTTRWTFSAGAWHRTPERAAAGQAFAPDTLVVIFAPVKDAGYRDPAGNAVPETVVEGSGRAVIFDGGDATEGTWHKSGRNGTLRFASRSGKKIRLKPGHIWLEAVPRGGSVRY